MINESFYLTILLFLVADTLIIILVMWFFFTAMKRFNTTSDFPKITDTWPAVSRPAGKKFYRQYIALNQIWYKNCANIIIADEGFYLSFGFPISLSISQAACIPWKYLSYQKKSRSFWTDVYEYQILLEKPVTLTVMARIARAFPELQKPNE